VTPLISAHSLVVTYPPTRALDLAGLSLFPGEIHALMGENGAGKSTLIRVLSGLRTPDSGTMMLGGLPYAPRSAHRAEAAGLATVHQEIDLIPTMTVEENLLLGREPTRGRWAGRFGLIQWRARRSRAAAALARVGVSLDTSRALGELPVGLRQMVAIARAIDASARVLILDEPTSSLDRAETRELFRVMRDLRAGGMAILFVSHFLGQVYEVSDRITVLRNGATVGSWPAPELPRPALIEAMTGRAFAERAPDRARADTHAGPPIAPHRPTPEQAATRPAPVFTFDSLARRASLAPVSGRVRAGETLGLAGLLGSGRSELARLLFGADRPDSGSVALSGTPLRPGSVRDAIARGVAMTPEDRASQGLILDLTVRENIILALQARRGGLRPVPRAQQRRLADHYIKALNIRAPGPEAPVASLSGGNQQKVLLARWLAVQPEVLILDEPARGVDVGARSEIESLIASLRARGLAIILISTELDELVRACDRVMVMRDRACAGTLEGDNLNEGAILRAIAGDDAPREEAAP